MVSMSRGTTALDHDTAPQSTDMEHSSDIPEKKTEFDARDAAKKTKEQTVKENAEPENDAPTPNGGPKAWLFVIATFLMFVSAW